MNSCPPKLIQRMTKQTLKAIFGLVLTTATYVWIYIDFIPSLYLSLWIFLQVGFIYFRFKNAQILNKLIKNNDLVQIQKHIRYFFLALIASAIIWNVAVFLSMAFAPPTYEFVALTMIVGVIMAGTLSLSIIYFAFLSFFLLMIIPQFFIMLSYGDDLHAGVAMLIVLAIPVMVLLARSIYKDQMEIVKTHESLQESVEELHKLSITDALTGVYNRRHFFETSKDFISIARRNKGDLSLLMIDIDYFKRVNDTYGHNAGDSALIALAEEIRNLLRESDVFARIGGEEFAVLLHDTPLDGAKTIAEKIRKTIEQRIFFHKDVELKIEVSIGISTLNETTNSMDALYELVDKKLYEAKESGRNRVCY